MKSSGFKGLLFLAAIVIAGWVALGIFAHSISDAPVIMKEYE